MAKSHSQPPIGLQKSTAFGASFCPGRDTGIGGEEAGRLDVGVETTADSATLIDDTPRPTDSGQWATSHLLTIETRAAAGPPSP